MSKYVDAIGLKETFCAECNHTLKCEDCDIDYHFSHFPAADVREDIHAEWIKESENCVMGEGYMWFCSRCQNRVYVATSGGFPKFCDECGARMKTDFDYYYDAAIEQLEHDILYEPTFSEEDGSM